MLHPLLRGAWSACAFCDTQAPITLEFFISLLYAVLHQRVLSKLGSEMSLHPHDRLCSGILKHAKCLLCSRRHFHSTCTPGSHRRNQAQQTWRVSLSIGMLHVTILCAIQVYQFFVMCQGITNNRVFGYLYLHCQSTVDLKGIKFIVMVTLFSCLSLSRQRLY
jgi:hypothetical protein